MLGDVTQAKEILIVCGYTDMRKSIDGLAGIIQANYALNPFGKQLFLFCGKQRNRMKALLWEDDGFVLLYKRLENGSFQWPRTAAQVRNLSWQEFRWLLEGLSIDQPRAIREAKPGEFC